MCACAQLAFWCDGNDTSKKSFLFRSLFFTWPAMMLNAVTKAAAGALRAVKPALLQPEVAKVSGVLSVNSEYKIIYNSPFQLLSKKISRTKTFSSPTFYRPFSLPHFLKSSTFIIYLNFSCIKYPNHHLDLCF